MRQVFSRILAVGLVGIWLLLPGATNAAQQVALDEYQVYHWVLDAVEEQGAEGENRRVTGTIQTEHVPTFFAADGYSDEEKEALIQENGSMLLSLEIPSESISVEHHYEWSALPLRIGQRLLTLDLAGDIRAEKTQGKAGIGTQMVLLLNRQEYGAVSANGSQSYPAQRGFTLDIPAPSNQGRTALIQLRAGDEGGSLTHTVNYYYRAEIGPAPSPTPLVTASPEPTASPTPSPTETPTEAPTLTPRPTGTPRATANPTPAATVSPQPTGSPRPSASPEPAAAPESTPTPVVDATAAPSQGQDETPAPVATFTPGEAEPFSQMMDALLLPVFERKAADPEEIPSHYNPAEEGQESLFVFEDPDGILRYRLYGSLDGADPAFYPSDARGRIAAGSDAISLAEEVAWVTGATKPPEITARHTAAVFPAVTEEPAPVQTPAPSPAAAEATAPPTETPEESPQLTNSPLPSATVSPSPAVPKEATPSTPPPAEAASSEPSESLVPISQLDGVLSGIPWWVFGIVAAIVVVVAALIPGKKK